MKNIRIFAATAIIFALLFPITGSATMRPVIKKRAGLPPFDVVKKLARGNDDRSPPEAGPLLCAWLADSSPGLTPDRILTNAGGRMIIARNLNAQMTLNATRAMDLAVRRLHLPVLLVTRSSDEQYLAAIANRPLAKSVIGRRTMLEKTIDNLVKKIVSRYRKRVKNGRLVVIGSIFDQADWYGRGYGQLLIININGIKNDSGLRAHQATALLSAEERRQHLGRHTGTD